MKLEIKRDAVLIVPENDHDRAFLEDSLKLTKTGADIRAVRVDDVKLGFSDPESFCVKLEAAK